MPELERPLQNPTNRSGFRPLAVTEGTLRTRSTGLDPVSQVPPSGPLRISESSFLTVPVPRRAGRSPRVSRSQRERGGDPVSGVAPSGSRALLPLCQAGSRCPSLSSGAGGGGGRGLVWGSRAVSSPRAASTPAWGRVHTARDWGPRPGSGSRTACARTAKGATGAFCLGTATSGRDRGSGAAERSLDRRGRKGRTGGCPGEEAGSVTAPNFPRSPWRIRKCPGSKSAEAGRLRK